MYIQYTVPEFELTTNEKKLILEPKSLTIFSVCSMATWCWNKSLWLAIPSIMTISNQSERLLIVYDISSRGWGQAFQFAIPISLKWRLRHFLILASLGRFLKGPFSASFYSFSSFQQFNSKQMFFLQITNGWMQTRVVWCWKQPLWHLRHLHCLWPYRIPLLVAKIFSATGDHTKDGESSDEICFWISA